MKQRKNPIHHPIKQLIFEMSIIWGLIFLGIILGIFGGRWKTVVLVSLWALMYARRTYEWIRIFLVVKFAQPKTIVTRGFLNLARDSFIMHKGHDTYYTLLWFDDERLKKGRYYYIEPIYLRRGMLLEIVYYPKARFIKTITKLPIEKK